jgi:hypothetical protein
MPAELAAALAAVEVGMRAGWEDRVSTASSTAMIDSAGTGRARRSSIARLHPSATTTAPPASARR